MLLSYLPSKRLIVLVASISISGAGLWLVATSKEPPPYKEPQKSVAARNSSPTPPSTQTHTFKQSEIVGTEPESEKSVPLPTDSLVKSAMILFKSKNISEENLQKILDEAGSNLNKLASETKDAYSAQDVKIGKNISVRMYLNEIGRITRENFSGTPEGTTYTNEVDLIKDILNEKVVAGDVVGELKKFSRRYIDAAENLKKTTVPQEMTSFHVELVNSFANTGLSLTQFSLLQKDPLIAIMGLRTYGEEVGRSTALVYGMRDISKKYNIVFLESEPGYELQQYFKRI